MTGDPQYSMCPECQRVAFRPYYNKRTLAKEGYVCDICQHTTKVTKQEKNFVRVSYGFYQGDKEQVIETYVYTVELKNKRDIMFLELRKYADKIHKKHMGV